MKIKVIKNINNVIEVRKFNESSLYNVFLAIKKYKVANIADANAKISQFILRFV